MKLLKVQIVDDDVDFAEGLADILQMHGYETVLAHSGAQALAQKQAQVFDLTLMDIRMPGMDGLQTFNGYRAVDPQSNVVMMTGFAAGELCDQAIEQGARGILYKPLNIDSLLEVVSRIAGASLVLVVDDDRDFVASIVDLLLPMGHIIETAFSGKEAIEKIEEHGFKLAVLDLRLGNVSGFDVIRRIQELNLTLPIIIVTAYLDEEQDNLELESAPQIEAIFSKPIDPARFIEVVERINVGR